MEVKWICGWRNASLCSVISGEVSISTGTLRGLMDEEGGSKYQRHLPSTKDEREEKRRKRGKRRLVSISVQ
jgi:hypothetical protein